MLQVNDAATKKIKKLTKTKADKKSKKSKKNKKDKQDRNAVLDSEQAGSAISSKIYTKDGDETSTKKRKRKEGSVDGGVTNGASSSKSSAAWITPAEAALYRKNNGKYTSWTIFARDTCGGNV